MKAETVLLFACKRGGKKKHEQEVLRVPAKGTCARIPCAWAALKLGARVDEMPLWGLRRQVKT